MSLSLSSARAPFIPMAAQAPRLPQAAQNAELATSASQASQGAGAADSKVDDDIRKAAESFEAIILRQLLASMRKAKLSEDVFGSSATDNFREMADARTADAMSNMRQFGIADMVERELRGMGAGSNNSHGTEANMKTDGNSLERMAR